MKEINAKLENLDQHICHSEIKSKLQFGKLCANEVIGKHSSLLLTLKAVNRYRFYYWVKSYNTTHLYRECTYIEIFKMKGFDFGFKHIFRNVCMIVKEAQHIS